MNFSGSGRFVLWGVSVVLVAIAAFVAADHYRNPDPVELRSYVVSPELSQELQSALAPTLDRAGGRIALLPEGRVVVTARASVQLGVRRIIDEIAANPPGPTPTVRFEAWIVSATVGGTADDGDLSEIEPALAVIRNTKGSLNFALVEKLSTLARAGRGNSKVQGAVSQMKIEATLRKAEANDPLIVAKVEIGIGGNIPIVNEFHATAALEAYTELRPGELLVVGQSAMPGAQGSPQKDMQVYYILRATL